MNSTGMLMVGSYDYRLVALSGLISILVMLLFVIVFTSSVNRVKRQKALLNELFEQAPEAVALMSVGNRVIRINREFTKVFGYAPREAVGRILDDLIVPEELRDEAQVYAKIVAHGRRVDAARVCLRASRRSLAIDVSLKRIYSDASNVLPDSALEPRSSSRLTRTT